MAFLGLIVEDDEDRVFLGMIGATDVSLNWASEGFLRGAEAIAEARRSY